ncbi:MAG: conserved rane protein of unknown function [Frankiales bacterium]|nr:conserved rane protein of unknown function [Frankiales bacterium]
MSPPPTNRRQAAKQLRAKQAENRQRIKEGTARGDEKAMMPRDAGPVRRLVRDTIDVRRSLGFLLLPVAALLIIGQVGGNQQLYAVAIALWLATLLAVAVDLILISVRLRSVITKAFPDEKRLRSHIAYGMLRSTVFPRFRMPPPQVKPGRKA